MQTTLVFPKQSSALEVVLLFIACLWTVENKLREPTEKLTVQKCKPSIQTDRLPRVKLVPYILLLNLSSMYLGV